MTTLHGLDGLRRLPEGCALSIGNFDGLHAGHRAIISALREKAGSHGDIAVASFEPHPLTVLRPEKAPPRLMSLDQKHRRLAEMGVDCLVVLPPTSEVLQTTAEAFWALLRDKTRPAHIVEGEHFFFGKDRGGSVEKLMTWSRGTAVKVNILPAATVTLSDQSVASASSSLVRWLLAHGRVRDAALCLLSPFTLSGVVVAGYRRGRTIGVPTANLDCGSQLVPADGVYAGRCRVDGVSYPVALSIGTAPTFDDAKRQVEAHLIGFAGDLYGRLLEVEVIDWLRDQWKFPDVDALTMRLGRDIAAAVEIAERETTQATPSRAARAGDTIARP